MAFYFYVEKNSYLLSKNNKRNRITKNNNRYNGKYMKWFFLLLGIIPILTNAKEIGTMTLHHKDGTSETIYYDNTYPQCISYKIFIGNTVGQYKGAYVGYQSLKKADENVYSMALDTFSSVRKQNLTFPYSLSNLMSDANEIKRIIFKGTNLDSKTYSSKYYDNCVVKFEASSVGENPNQNYDREVNYSKGEDKIKREKITKIEQVCDREDFPKTMEDARNSIKSFTSFLTPKMTVDGYLKHTNYKYINRLAEDMLQAGLDDGTINTQFLSSLYKFPRRGLSSGSLLPRCKINQ